MPKYASGRHALAISDRSGLQFPWREMVTEWTGAFVHMSEYEPKQPQLRPKTLSADSISLTKVRPARTAFPTPVILPNNPFTTTVSTTVTVTQPSHNFSSGDAVRFRQVKEAVGGVSITTLELETTLNGDITAAVTSLTLTDASAFPSSGYIYVQTKPTAAQTRAGENIVLGEMFVEDDSGQIWIKGWRKQAGLIEGFSVGEIISITTVNAKPGLDGKTELFLTPYSTITKKN